MKPETNPDGLRTFGSSMTKICPNCQTDNEQDDRFCRHCGQRFDPLVIKVRTLLSELVSNVLAWDNRFFRTVRQLFRPASLTRLFFEGKREQFIHPVRLYFFSVVLHLAIISVFLTGSPFMISDQDRDSGKALVNLNSQIKAVQEVRDSLSAKADPQVIQGVDSALARLERTFDAANDTLSLNFTGGDSSAMEFSLLDLEALPLDSFSQRFANRHWILRIIGNQFVKSYRNPKALGNFILGRLSWLMFLIIPIVGLILAGLYVRQHRYYVEHLVFALHYHVAAYLLVSAGILTDYLVGLGLTKGSLILILPYTYLAQKAYYRQSHGRTLAKWLILQSLYLLVFLVLGLILTITSFLMFD